MWIIGKRDEGRGGERGERGVGRGREREREGGREREREKERERSTVYLRGTLRKSIGINKT